MDGFKCYSTSVAIKNLDRNFTAITGMNGSGKSNIIDAIIFALDLNTSKYMRVSSLKELININRKECTVTLIFDNSNKSSSPAGYESFETIEITRSLDHEGKSKYKLNNHNATKNSIESLCKSIGITNNFVIMQGHITKIINMKNTDLKKMIEETAGTRSYSEEREKSLEVLQKKEFKLREAREHLHKTISPFFEQLKREKRIFEENRDFEVNRKAYMSELKSLENLLAKDIANEKVKELSKICEKYISDIKNLEEVESKVKSTFTNEENTKMDISNQLNSYKNKLDELKMQNFEELISEKALIKEEKLKKIQSFTNGDLQDLKERESILSKELLSNSNFDKLSELELSRNTLNKKEIALSNANIGVTESIKGILQSENSPNGRNTDSNGRDKQNLIEKEILKVLMNISNTLACNQEPDSNILFIKEKVKEIQASVSKLKVLEEKIVNMKSKINYPVLDGVFGIVDENFDLVDEKYKEAIFTILGGRSKFIICKDEEIASKILNNSDRKVSCIPLSKIAYSEPSNVPYKCINALKAISFDPQFHKAFKHIFSGFYLFEDNETASKCCYDCKVMCVTLDGTVYDPKGTLTCGKSTFKPNVVKMTELISLQSEYNVIKENIPSSSLIIQITELLSKLESKEILEAEVKRLFVKNEMIEKLCSSNVNVSKELEKIRSRIVEVANGEKVRSLLNKEIKALEEEIAELSNKRDQAVPLINEILKKIETLTKQQEEYEQRQLKRKTSIKMFEIYDEKRKELIKSTVQLESRINKLYQEIKTISSNVSNDDNTIKPKFQNKKIKDESSFDSENQPNFSISNNAFKEQDCSSEPQLGSIVSSHLSFLFEKFEISPHIFNLPLSKLKFDRNSCESQIQILKDKINQKRITISMDPSNFELLEKNILQVQTLEEKINKLEKDRQEILTNIEKLNEIGMSENLRAFAHINKQIKQFLQYFLPNTDILITPEFEIRVKIGNWKNSLSELSGGQKSLIALCLMFSMLTFRPAPFYIFDEIDAALDLNYTQAIGEIIKNEFKGAQFIVISLKNNMFDYANKIFKVFIQDHRSKISQIK